MEESHQKAPLRDHDYATPFIAPKDIPIADEQEKVSSNNEINSDEEEESEFFAKKFAKCELCRRSRTKVIRVARLLKFQKPISIWKT